MASVSPSWSAEAGPARQVAAVCLRVLRDTSTRHYLGRDTVGGQRPTFGGVGRAMGGGGWGDLQGTGGAISQKSASCDDSDPTMLIVALDAGSEIRKRFPATFTTSQDGDSSSKNAANAEIDWRCFDGGFENGEKLGVGGYVGMQEMDCELDYEEKKEELKGEIPQ
ncbi:hypothetical protein NDU88_009366 [Pleurodeles waltl]|uniref:Uncharacterized protein n=1 Tax=Pleurodeles waltl TaxID=8319 RepID=A0AAV7QRF7_PLEWA|nr:hypothetical protein NDU88_009366 [Pleurodeles waltl]